MAVKTADRFLELGEYEHLDGRSENGQRVVDNDFFETLAELINESPLDYSMSRPCWTRDALSRALLRKTSVRVSVSAPARMLMALRARWGRPRPRVRHLWSGRSKRHRMRQFEELITKCPKDEVLFYEDEVDIHLKLRIGRT